jgi:hypothetical protein
MSANQNKTDVILMGTMHLDPSDYPEYASRLNDIIEEISPDIICSELSPEQLNGTQTCNSKPEQRDVVMPTARRLGIPIVPMQPATDTAIEWEKRYKAAVEELKSGNDSRYYLEISDLLAEYEAESWMRLVKSEDCIENVQLNECHVYPEARDKVSEKLAPELASVMTEWNEYFLSSILLTSEQDPGRRILVIMGLWHKYWLWNQLEKHDHIRVHNLHTFRASRQ